ncbi:cilia- and flagella-associated protein 70-like [Protopterus annectens]|uniref:cilia- and flagella-associated protein 70-like n=1 Tax=Protopterus annectens TaxID=7888 RepID=UPI001CF96D09|nr:cilia- and flagella-associated protein 70-like [Protopterus annectens]
MDAQAAPVEVKPRPVQITVVRGRHMKNTKGTVLHSYVRVEFNGILLGDSPKMEVISEKEVEYNFTVSFDCAVNEGQNGLDDIAHKPVILTLVEILPKEKKQKEEKTAVLGQGLLDLLPLLQGDQSFLRLIFVLLLLLLLLLFVYMCTKCRTEIIKAIIGENEKEMDEMFSNLEHVNQNIISDLMFTTDKEKFRYYDILEKIEGSCNNVYS